MEPQTSYVIHRSENDGPRINVKVERNTRGYNWEATVTGAQSVEDAFSLLDNAVARLEREYGKEPPK